MCLLVPFLSHSNPAENVFNGMVKTTEARGYKNSGGYSVGFGAISARTPQVTFSSLYAVRAPSFRYGCNGIDFNLGAFSIINKDELVQQLRSVAQGSLMYAFGIAVDAMCSGCWQQMQKWANEIQEHAQLLRGGCEEMVEKFGDPLRESIRSNALVQGIRDTFELGTSEDASEQYDKHNTQSIKDQCGDECNVNYLYEYFKNSRYMGSSFIADTVAFGDQEFFEIFQSLIGNVVIDTSAGDADVDADIASYRPLTVEAFLFGKNPGEENEAVQVLRCNNWDEGCWSVTPTDDASWTGVVPTIIADMNTLMTKVRSGTNRLTEREAALRSLIPLGADSLPYIAKNQDIAADFAVAIGEQVAANVVLDMMRQYERAYREITSKGTTKQIPQEALERLDKNTVMLRENAQLLSDKSEKVLIRANAMIDSINNLKRALRTE